MRGFSLQSKLGQQTPSPGQMADMSMMCGFAGPTNFIRSALPQLVAAMLLIVSPGCTMCTLPLGQLGGWPLGGKAQSATKAASALQA
jgi:hypothetical protein